MYYDNKLVIGKNKEKELYIVPKMANRHGIITGASGSGKTTTVKVMAESFSSAGIPVFYVDVKGDLASICKEGVSNSNIEDRLNTLGISDFKFSSFPTTFFDVFGKSGHPIRTTIENIGPRLLSRMLELSDAQEGILAIIFQIAKDEDMKLNDLDDLKSLISYVNDNRSEYTSKYGTITSLSISTIQRNLLMLEQEEGQCFFGKPELQLFDLLQYDMDGKGFVNVLDAVELYKKPTLYAVFLIWLLNNLFDNMPEVGDLDKPKLILFLDEAHLIFSEMSSNLVKSIIQVIKLIRSKGVGVYFISQSPSDIPEEILAQLGNKVQHVLRSYTPSDEKAIKAAANSFRTNPNFKTEDEIKNLATGEALISFLNESGEPNIVERAMILPPQSFMGTITDEERSNVIKQSRIYMKYENINNEESATEKVDVAKKEKEDKAIAEKKAIEEAKEKEKADKLKAKEEEKKKKEQDKMMKKVTNQVTNKMIGKATTKVVNSLWKNLFK